MTEAPSDAQSIQDRVNAICNDLYGQGTKPSVRIVLSMLPDVSSTSTVHKYFVNWKKELAANQQSLYDRLGFSSEFTQSFMKEITRFGVEAEQRYKEQAQDANEQRDLVLEDLERSEERMHKQAALVEQQEKEVKELQTELLTVKKHLEAELAKTQEAHEATVSELRQQLADASNDNEALRQQNETLRTDIAKAELKLEGNQAFVDEVKSHNTELATENKTLHQQVAELNKTLASYEATIQGNDKLLARLERDHMKLETANKELETQQAKIIVERDQARQLLGDSEKQLTKATDAITDLKLTVAEQSKVISTFTGRDE